MAAPAEPGAGGSPGRGPPPASSARREALAKWGAEQPGVAAMGLSAGRLDEVLVDAGGHVGKAKVALAKMAKVHDWRQRQSSRSTQQSAERRQAQDEAARRQQLDSRAAWAGQQRAAHATLSSEIRGMLELHREEHWAAAEEVGFRADPPAGISPGRVCH